MTYEENNALIHYGVKNQKWGVRRYQNEDGTLTELGKKHYSLESDKSPGNSKFAKKYEHEMKKLKKYDDQSDRVGQLEKVIKYDSRAKTAKRIGKTALAVAVPAFGIAGLAANRDELYKQLADTNFDAAGKLAYIEKTKDLAATPVETKRIMGDAAKGYGTVMNVTSKVGQELLPPKAYATGATVVSSVAGATAIAAYGAAAYNKLLSKNAKKYISDKGHAKAVEKRDAQYKKIRNMVGNTPYRYLFQKQIEEYKKEHPNSELSDKEIMKNLM